MVYAPGFQYEHKGCTKVALPELTITLPAEMPLHNVRFSTALMRESS